MNNFNNIISIDFDKLEQLDNIIHSRISFKQTSIAGIIGRISPLYIENKIKKLFELITIPNTIKNIPY